MATQTISVSETKTKTWHFVNTIDGASSKNSLSHHGIDPSTKKQLWGVPIATEEDLEKAVAAAQDAFKTWSRTSWQSRQEILARIRQTLADQAGEMSEILSQECGKPVSIGTKATSMAELTGDL